MSNQTKFALHNYSGVPTSFFLAEERIVTNDSAQEEKEPVPSHLIFIVDCSGSMYYDIREIRPTIEKLLAVEEFHNQGMLITLLSYASQGDVMEHFARIPVEQVMAAGSAHIEQIRQLRTRGLTCVSQALEMAKKYVQTDETTCISLHSDGYANDRSPATEKREIDRIIGDLQNLDGVFVNTVAYRNWSDFQTLSHIANSCSGTCLRANSVKEVYDALHDTSRLLTGNLAPALVSELNDATYQVFMSASAQKIIGAADDLKIRGLAESDDKTVYRYKEVSEADFNASSAPESRENAAEVLAFARASINEGALNRAKYAVVTSRNGDLLNTHYRALTGPEIAEMASDIDEYLFDSAKPYQTTNGYGLESNLPNVLSILTVLDANRDGFRVNMDALKKNYKRRGVRRVPGVRDEQTGQVVPPDYTTISRGDSNNFIPVNGFDVNRNTATVNMRIARPIWLAKQDKTPIKEVAGIPLDNLSSFNNYTLVGDGTVNVDELCITVSSKRLWNTLVNMGVPGFTNNFDPTKEYTIPLANLPLVNFDQTFSISPDTFEELAGLTVVQKFLSGITKDSSTEYTPEQIQALKDHYLSPNLYVNFPTTNEYADLNEALTKGVVDTRLSYKINVGTKEMLNLSNLHSGNKAFDRYFVVEQEGKKVAKPKLPILLDEVNVTEKAMSARTKFTKVDELMKPILMDLLGVSANFDSGVAVEILNEAGLEASRILDVTARRIVRGDDAVEILNEAARKVSSRIEEIYTNEISPLVFYIGSTGLVPDEFDATSMTAEELKAAYPDLKPSKAEADGTFFVVGDSVISVFVKGEYFSTGRKLEEAA